jgi:hypothetical protein
MAKDKEKSWWDKAGTARVTDEMVIKSKEALKKRKEDAPKDGKLFWERKKK